MRQLTLDNGLRVVLDARGDAPAVGVAVHYGTGFRGDPVGRSGFAHLFEHLMFQGSGRVAPGEHFSVVQGSGGTAAARPTRTTRTSTRSPRPRRWSGCCSWRPTGWRACA
ncbi:insulinase family protein [Streptomyces thermocarboxydus]